MQYIPSSTATTITPAVAVAHKPEIRYTELSTEQLVSDFDDNYGSGVVGNGCDANTIAEHFSMKNLKTFHKSPDRLDDDDDDDVSIMMAVHNRGYVSTTRPNQYVYENGSYGGESVPYRNGVMSKTNNNVNGSSSNQFAQQQQHHHHYRPQPADPNDCDQLTDNYIMPQHYIARSPNLNRNATSRQRNTKQLTTGYDQIRDPPPGYDRNYSMQRVRSHDRLSQRKHSGTGSNGSSRNRKRPRSYCSNGSSFPEQL